MPDNATAKGWQRIGLAVSHYFDAHASTSLCGKARRSSDLPVGEEADWKQCVVCFALMMALPPQPKLF